MSTSLQIERARAEAPDGVDDRLEQLTWVSCRISVSDRCVTEHLESEGSRKSERIEIPLFPIAEWLVQNWWAMLYEPCRGERPPRENSNWGLETKLWITRHCIRSSDSALVLPYLHLYSIGEKLSAVWYEDDDYANDTRYIASGSELVDRATTEAELSNLVGDVLDWCSGEGDRRVESLRCDWAAIREASSGEREFCRAAGCMGLDPYFTDEWPESVAEFLTDIIGARIQEPLVQDLLEATEPERAPGLWNWVDNSKRSYNLSRRNPLFTEQSRYPRGKDHGYWVARKLREMVDISEGAPIDDLSAFFQKLGGLTLTLENHNSVPSSKVSAIVGWTGETRACIAGPLSSRPDSQRFLQARGLYHAVTGCARGPRLITKAFTWDQQAGRAFAAELLAPKDALAERARADMDDEERLVLQQELASGYGVSAEVIRRQLQNHGVWNEAGI